MSEKRESHDEFILRNMREAALKDRVSKASRMVWVTFEKEGLHKYPAALDDPKLATGDKYDVSFLSFVSGLKYSTMIVILSLFNLNVG